MNIRAVLQGSELQATIESQLRSFEELVDFAGVAGVDALDQTLGTVRFLKGPSARTVPCRHCGRPFFRASLPFHQERCAQRPAPTPADAQSPPSPEATEAPAHLAQAPASSPKAEGATREPKAAPQARLRDAPPRACGRRAAERPTSLHDAHRRPRPRELAAAGAVAAARRAAATEFFSIATPPVTPEAPVRCSSARTHASSPDAGDERPRPPPCASARPAVAAAAPPLLASAPTSEGRPHGTTPLARLAALRGEMRALRAGVLSGGGGDAGRRREGAGADSPPSSEGGGSPGSPASASSRDDGDAA